MREYGFSWYWKLSKSNQRQKQMNSEYELRPKHVKNIHQNSWVWNFEVLTTSMGKLIINSYCPYYFWKETGDRGKKLTTFGEELETSYHMRTNVQKTGCNCWHQWGQVVALTSEPPRCIPNVATDLFHKWRLWQGNN